ncbi:hypothetical protein H0H87_007114 [Tephrocybe sp. NHM501043]|nr:hypothetical protein H0H87_007114 [Tephrocybe sp. NHM501043]
METMLSIFNALVKIVFSSQGQVKPWISWKDTHAGFSTVEIFSAQLWRADPAWNVVLEHSRWTMVARGLIFFTLFGIADENAVASPNFGAKSSVEPKLVLPEARCSIVLDIRSPEGNISVLSHIDNALRFEDDHEGNFTACQSSVADTFESVCSIDAEHGHGPTHPGNAKYDLESTGVVIFPSCVLNKLKDLPLLPHEEFTRPTSVTTSASMYSTDTLPETDFTFTVDLVSPPAVFFHSPYTGQDRALRFNEGTPYTSLAMPRPDDLDLERFVP